MRFLKKEYITRGMGPFTYEMKGRVMTMSYYEVPPEILEQPLELVLWARRALILAAQKKGRPETALKQRCVFRLFSWRRVLP